MIWVKVSTLKEVMTTWACGACSFFRKRLHSRNRITSIGVWITCSSGEPGPVLLLRLLLLPPPRQPSHGVRTLSILWVFFSYLRPSAKLHFVWPHLDHLGPGWPDITDSQNEVWSQTGPFLEQVAPDRARSDSRAVSSYPDLLPVHSFLYKNKNSLLIMLNITVYAMRNTDEDRITRETKRVGRDGMDEMR